LPEVICNTSPLQYLHQLGLLTILPALAGRVTVPTAVEEEINAGRRLGVSLPDLRSLDWLTIGRPESKKILPMITDLGAGEAEVLMMALERADPLVILDDGLARRLAETLEIPLTGTLGLLLDAKTAGLIDAVAPVLDRLQTLRFRLSPRTRESILRLAGEAP
jgi:predicted nucleic acid-binding protein